MKAATCHCGELTVECEGDPKMVVMCHCEMCQRRTGSSHGVANWFDRSAVTSRGSEQVFARIGDDTGSELRFHFCPTCGTSVYWEAQEGIFADVVAVAAGCFTDPASPPPMMSIYGARRPKWLAEQAGIPSYLGSTASDLE